MLTEKDVALIGTGVAPLIAASHLISHGKAPLILNPDWDFFREDSELPIDPIYPTEQSADFLKKSESDFVLDHLRPDFPGAVEFWDGSDSDQQSFHDETAPHVRSRSRLWVSSALSVGTKTDPKRNWESLERMFLEASDAGLNPQELDGLSAAKRFPGFSSDPKTEIKGILLPKLCDWDVNRYRFGLHEYVKERAGADLVSRASQIQLIPGGVRFYANGKLRTEKIQGGLIVFWTPTLTPWLEANFNVTLKPKGVRIWEEWSMISREHVDTKTIGVFEDMHVWTSFEGTPKGDDDPLSYLSVLRPGKLIPLEDFHPLELSAEWISGESFEDVSRLCHDFLNWEKVTIRKVRPRAIFDWGDQKQKKQILLKDRKVKTKIMIPSDGALNHIAYASRKVVEDLV